MLPLKPVLLRLLATALAACALTGASAQGTGAGGALAEPSWVQVAPSGRDAAVSPDGQRWIIDADGRALRWQPTRGAWVPHGSRRDLARIAAGGAGAAAVTTSGDVLVTSSAADDGWRSLGVRAADVGIGGGRLWLADGRGSDGAAALLQSPFDPTGRTPAWQRLERRFTRVAVDPAGRPWALDAGGRLFVHDGSQWQPQAGAPPAADVGVGASGAVLLVGLAADAPQGGGIVYQRAAGGTAWRVLPGRLSTVSVDADGRAFGIHAQAWVLASVAAAEADAAVAQALPPGDPQPGPGDADGKPVTTLAELAGAGLPLPAGIGRAPVSRLEGDLARGTFVGRTRLNGLSATVVRYTPVGGSQPVLALGHDSLALGDYIPELVSTALQTLRLSRPVFFFVAPGQGGLAASTADGAVLNRALKRADLGEQTPSEGLSVQATVEVKQVPAFAASALMLGLGGDTVAVSGQGLSPTLFASVAPGAAPPVPVQVSWAAFRATYGEALRRLELRAPARDLEGRSAGPVQIKSPVWTLSAAPGNSGVELVVALDTQLEMSLRGAALNETLAVRDARLVLEPLTRTARLTGSLTRDEAKTVASLRSLQLEDIRFEGQLVIGSSAAANAPLPVEALQLTLNGKGQVPALRLLSGGPAAGSGSAVPLDLQLTLSLDDARTALVPSVTLSGKLTLADLSGIDSAPARAVELKEVSWTPGTLQGRASLYGLTLRAVRHQGDTGPVVVGLAHQELDLATYVPRLRQTPQLGSLSLSNAVAFVLPESAAAQVYATRAEMPAALAGLLDRPDMPDGQIFPLRLAPGVTVVGQIDTTPTAQGGITQKALAAWGLAGERYVVKGSFRASALRNASFGTATNSAAGEVRSVSARDVACAAVSAADSLPTEGLDLSFPVPDFKPPYAGRNLEFSSTRFAVKDIDGQLEPALVTALRIRLPRETQGQLMGLTQLDLAAKLQLRGDLSVLCNGITPDTNGQVALAGVTAFNPVQIAGVAFRSLDRLSADELPPEPTAAEPAAAPAPLPPAMERLAQQVARAVANAVPKASMGWKRAFGLPFLTVNQLGLSAVIGQQDGKRSLTGTLWTDSVLGSERVDVLGRLGLEAADAQAEFAASDWLLLAPGPVKLTGLPGMAQLNQRLPVLELGDLTVSRLSLAPTQMSGRLALPSRRMQGSAVFTLGPDSTPDAPAFELYAGVNRFAPNWLLKPGAQVFGAAGALTLGDTFIALRGAPTVDQQAVSELPAAVKGLLASAAGPLLADDASFPLVRGLTLAGRVTPGEIPADAALAPVKSFFGTLGLTAPLPLLGGVEAAPAGSTSTEPKGSFLEALVANVTVPGLPDGGAAAVRNLRVSLSSRDGRRISGTGQGRFTLPASLRATLGQVAPSNAQVQFAHERSPAGDSVTQWSAATDVAWPDSLSLPDLSLGNLILEVESRQGGSQPLSSSFQVSAVGSYRSVPVKARLRGEQLTAAAGAPASGNRLAELSAAEPDGRLNLATLLNPLALLPAGYDSSAAPAALFSNLSASRLLLAREARTGRVTLAAEDVTGTLRDQPFSGQLAVVGITSSPVLYVRSDAPLIAGRVFGAMVEASPLGDVSLPQGLVILSPSRVNLNLSEIPGAIAEKVFADLLDSGTAELLANEGLTVLARVNLPDGLPVAMQELVPWLPTSGRLLLGAGVERASADGPRMVALFASAQGMNLRIPTFASSVVKSAGGQVLFTARSVGSGAAALTEASLQTNATVLVPRLTQPGSRELNTQISLNTRRQGNGDGELLLRVATDLSLPGWLSLPQFTAGNLGLELGTLRRGATTTNSVVLSADATLATVKAKARLGLDTRNGGFDGGLVELIAAEDGGRFDLATLLAPLNVPASYGLVAPNLPLSPWNYLKSFSTRGVLLAQAAGSGTLEVAARDVRGQLNDQVFAGQFAAVVRPAGPVLFVRSDTALTADRVFPSPVKLGPFGALGLPEGLVILSPQNGDVNLSTLHPRIYEQVFASFFDSPASAIVPARNGLAVLAKLNLGSALPAPLDLVSGWLPASGRLIVGGGIEDAGSAAPKLAFYANVQGLTLRVPSPLDNFVQTVGGNVVFFFKTKGGAGAGAELGLQTAVKIKAPRLDTLQQQPVDATLNLTASSETGSPATLTIGAAVTGTWNQPLGLGGFALTNTQVDLGTSATGFVVNINSERAEFSTSGGTKKSMVLDLFSTWTPAGVPSKLSLQLAPSPPPAGDLVLSPSDYAELVNSVLQLGMKGSSELAKQARSRLPAGAPLNVFDGFAGRLGQAGTTAMGLMRYTPLAMVGLKNPTVFFATPGEEPPRRQGVEQPPFGLGLRASGQLVFDTGRHTHEMATGTVKMDLLNGWSVQGSTTAPNPFSGNTFTVSGSQPLLQATPGAMRLSGKLEVPGASVGSYGATAEGSFDFVRSAEMSSPTDFNVSGSISLGGLASRSASLTVRGTTLTVNSTASACIDIPLSLQGTLSLPTTSPDAVVGLVKFGSVTGAVLNCTPGWLRDTVGPAVDAVLSVGGSATAVASQGAAAVISGVANVPVVGGPAAAAAETAFNAAVNPSRTAAQAADFAINAAVLTATNPGAAASAAIRALGNAFGAAKRELDSAIDGLSNIGCKLFGWMPGDHPCRRRERAARARRDAAAAAAAEAERAYVEAYFRAQEAAAQAPFAAAERQRWEAQKNRNQEFVQNQIAKQAEVDRVLSLASAARCAHTQVWDPNMRLCVAPGTGLIAYTAAGDTPTRCLTRTASVAGAQLSSRACARNEWVYWQLTNDFQIRAVKPDSVLAPTSTSDLCVQRPQNPAQDGTLSLQPCKTGSGANSVLNARTTGWVFTPSGHFTVEGSERCMLPVATDNGAAVGWRLCSTAAANPGTLQWTPVVPVDRVGMANLPRTARLRLGGTNLCVTNSGAYQAGLPLRPCADSNLDQDFSFGFESARYATIQSRSRLSCISIGNYRETAAVERLPQTEACFATPEQQFEPMRQASGEFRFVNRATSKCLSGYNVSAAELQGAETELVEADCGDAALAQTFQAVAVTGRDETRYPRWSSKKPLLLQDEALASFTQSNANYYPFALTNGSRCVGNPRAGSAELTDVSAGCSGVMLMPGRLGGPNHVSLGFMQEANEGRPTDIDSSLFAKWKDALVLKPRATAGNNPQLAQPPAVVFERTQLQSTAWELQATFKLVPALSGAANAFSFESVWQPGNFLARSGNALVLVPVATASQRSDASFLLVPKSTRR